MTHPVQHPPAPDGAPGVNDEPDVGARLAALTDAVERLARSHQALLESGGQTTPTDPQPLAASHRPDANPAAGTRDDLRRVVAEVLAERDSSARRSDARQRYVGEHMGDLPEAYRRQVPETDDPAALATAEREVRRRYREDFRAALGRFADLGGAGGAGSDEGDGELTPDRFAGLEDVAGDVGLGGERPGAVVDWSKLSPLQQITLGLRDAKPQGAVTARVAQRGKPAAAPQKPSNKVEAAAAD